MGKGLANRSTVTVGQCVDRTSTIRRMTTFCSVRRGSRTERLQTPGRLARFPHSYDAREEAGGAVEPTVNGQVMSRRCLRSTIARVLAAVLLLAWTAIARADTSTQSSPTGNPPGGRAAPADSPDSADAELATLIEKVITTLGPMLTGEVKRDREGLLAHEALASAVRQRGERAAPPLVRAVKDQLKARNYPLAARFMVLLGHVGGDKAREFLKDLGTSFEDGSVRTAALRSYALTRDKGMVRVLANALRTDQGIIDRNGLIYDLGRTRDSAALPFLTDILQRANISERAFAATALGDIRDVAAVEPLRRVISQDPACPVRANAILAIGRIGGKGSIEYLARLVAAGREPKEEVAAVAALGLIGGREAVDALVKVVNDPGASPAARARAQQEIGSLRAQAQDPRPGEVSVDAAHQTRRRGEAP